MILDVCIPMPPSVNRIWRKGRHGMYRSSPYMAWRQAAAEAVSGVWSGNPYAGSVSVELRVYGASRRRYDLDNRAKAVLDLFESVGVLEDDGQVDRLVLRRGPIVKGGGVWAIVQPMDAECVPGWPHAI